MHERYTNIIKMQNKIKARLHCTPHVFCVLISEMFNKKSTTLKITIDLLL